VEKRKRKRRRKQRKGGREGIGFEGTYAGVSLKCTVYSK
jgi:hypothetical protein